MIEYTGYLFIAVLVNFKSQQSTSALVFFSSSLIINGYVSPVCTVCVNDLEVHSSSTQFLQS